MSKIRLLLALLVASLCSVPMLHARTTPILPVAQALESGKTYYLYNVGSDRFMSYNNSNTVAKTDAGMEVKVTAVNGSQYNLQFMANERYLSSSGNSTVRVEQASSPSSNYYRFTITEVEGGYAIQRVYNAVDSLYLGYNGSNYDYVVSDVTPNGNIVWQFMEVTEAARYIAKRNLYRALESADGYAVDVYESIYENGASTNTDLQDAADRLNTAMEATTTATPPSWSDYKTLIEPTGEWNFYSTGTYRSPSIKNSQTTLSATVRVDGDATLSFQYYYTTYNYGQTLGVYLDNVLQYTINSYEGTIKSGTNEKQRFFVDMPAGLHTVTLKYINNSSNDIFCYIYDLGVSSTPTIAVSLKEAGSLGTEVLYKTDNIANVRKLIVSGPMNGDDWKRIQMMTSLFSIDLTGAAITEVPDKALSYHNYDAFKFLHEVKLPKTIKRIGNEAFYQTNIDELIFPDSLTTIGYYAFAYTRIKEAILPNTLTTFEVQSYGSDGSNTFANNSSLTKVYLPPSAVTIPSYCFYNCNTLLPFAIPEGITTIGNRAFEKCYKFDSAIPSTVKSIGEYAFSNSGITNAILAENIAIGNYAFQYCSRLTTVKFPTTYYIERQYNLLSNCKKLTDVTFKSPTMVTSSLDEMFEGNDMASINLHVPSYLVNTYKQDSYWYNCNVVAFPTSDIKEWTINNALKLGESDRLEGTPSVNVSTSGSITINGNTPMSINELTIYRDGGYYYSTTYHDYYKDFITGQLLMNSENINVAGKFNYKMYTKEKKWHFLCLPFDLKVSDLKNDAGASYAIRYYDGATRAENGASGNWKNYSVDDIIPAGTGFIYQTSQDTWTTFTAQDNEAKQYALSNKILTKALEANVSDNTADKGWNLVGNPWVSYYNIHKLNFVAPITVWDAQNSVYAAYSVIDDDYAIKPSEAFFVQCPDEVNCISFPIDGRQLTSTIEDQNGAKPAFTAKNRKLVDLEISNGYTKDKTRVVLNNQAQATYETARDAGKFMSLDGSVPQLYTVGTDGTRYAINERPEGDGNVSLGIAIQQQDTYTIQATRNDLGSIILTDNELGQQVDLSQSSYTFTTSAGTFNSRFTLSLNGNGVTGISNTKNNAEYNVKVGDGTISISGKATVYGIDGRKVAEVDNSTIGVASGVYIVRTGKSTIKVTVK